MQRVHNWPSLLLKIAPVLSSSNPVTADISNGDSSVILSSGGKMNRLLRVLDNLATCKGVTSSLINVQLAVISLHRLLIQVSSSVMQIPQTTKLFNILDRDRPRSNRLLPRKHRSASTVLLQLGQVGASDSSRPLRFASISAKFQIPA